MDCSLPGSSVCGILQARIVEWVAISFSRGSSWLKNWTPGPPALKAGDLPTELWGKLILFTSLLTALPPELLPGHPPPQLQPPHLLPSSVLTSPHLLPKALLLSLQNLQLTFLIVQSSLAFQSKLWSLINVLCWKRNLPLWPLRGLEDLAETLEFAFFLVPLHHFLIYQPLSKSTPIYFFSDVC